MSALTVNLKQFYQRKGMWLMYAFWAFNGYLLYRMAELFSRRGETFNPAYLNLWQMALSILSGVFVGSMLGEGLIRPLVFVLPRHPDNLRKTLLAFGLFISGMWCLLFALLPTTMGLKFEANLWGSFGLNIFGFALGAAFPFAGIWKIFLFWIVLPFIFWQGPGFVPILYYLINQYPWAPLGLAFVLGVLGWRYLGKDGLVRDFQDQRWLPFFGVVPFSKRKYAKTKTPGPAAIGIERFFLKRIQARKPVGTMGYIWGQLYTFWWNFLQKQTLIVLSIFLTIILIFSGYLSSGKDDKDVLDMIAMAFSFFTSLPLYSSQLLNGGRKERFISTVAISFSCGIGLILLFIVMLLESLILKSILPDISILGHVISFHPLSVHKLFFPLFIMPWMLTLRVLWRYRPLYGILFIIAQLLFFGLATHYITLPDWMRSLLYIECILIIGVWTILIFACWIASLRASLVKERA